MINISNRNRIKDLYNDLKENAESGNIKIAFRACLELIDKCASLENMTFEEWYDTKIGITEKSPFDDKYSINVTGKFLYELFKYDYLINDNTSIDKNLNDKLGGENIIICQTGKLKQIIFKPNILNICWTVIRVVDRYIRPTYFTPEIK